MTIRTIIPTEQTRRKIEGIVRDCCPIKGADLASALNMSAVTTSRHIRALSKRGRVHRVKPAGRRAPAGGIWAPGPEPIVPGMAGQVDIQGIIRLPSVTVRIGLLEAHFFGRATVSEVRP